MQFATLTASWHGSRRRSTPCGSSCRAAASRCRATHHRLLPPKPTDSTGRRMRRATSADRSPAQRQPVRRARKLLSLMAAGQIVQFNNTVTTPGQMDFTETSADRQRADAADRRGQNFRPLLRPDAALPARPGHAAAFPEASSFANVFSATQVAVSALSLIALEAQRPTDRYRSPPRALHGRDGVRRPMKWSRSAAGMVGDANSRNPARMSDGALPPATMPGRKPTGV